MIKRKYFVYVIIFVMTMYWLIKIFCGTSQGFVISIEMCVKNNTWKRVPVVIPIAM